MKIYEVMVKDASGNLLATRYSPSFELGSLMLKKLSKKYQVSDTWGDFCPVGVRTSSLDFIDALNEWSKKSDVPVDIASELGEFAVTEPLIPPTDSDVLN